MKLEPGDCGYDGIHETGWCEPPMDDIGSAGRLWTCPECGRVSESFRLDDGSLPDSNLRALALHGYDLSTMYGWRGKATE